MVDNKIVCFGHRLTHIIGKLLLIPIESTANLTVELRKELQQIYMNDDSERLKHDENIDDRKYPEPDENGKYQLTKALMFHAKEIDEHRAAYYLGLVLDIHIFIIHYFSVYILTICMTYQFVEF